MFYDLSCMLDTCDVRHKSKLSSNDLTKLPVGIFDSITTLQKL